MSNPSAWELVADEVLAVMLAHQAGYERARYEHSAMIDHFPPGPYRDTVRALDALRMTGKPVHVTTLHTDSNVSLEWLSERFVLATAAQKLDGPVLAENVRRMREYGTAYAQRAVMQWGAQALATADHADKRAEIISTVVTKLGLDISEDVLEATAEAAAARFETELNAPPLPTLITGIPWLDVETGGIGRGMIWWIAAAYKRRKSTLLRIMALAQAEAGISVTVCALEGTQRQWVADFISMLAVRWLWENGHWEKTERGIPLHAISSSLLMAWGNGYKHLHPLKVAAINAGIIAYKALGDRLRIYDRQPENGGIGTLTSIETIINRDVARYGAQVVYVDHLQLVDAGKQTEFENVTESSRGFQRMAASKDISMVVLAQLNEEAVKYGGKSHSPGIKGGGAPAATADVILETGYPKNLDTDTEDKTRLQVKVGWARRGSEGGVKDFAMHPATGYLIPADLHNAADEAGDHAAGEVRGVGG